MPEVMLKRDWPSTFRRTVRNVKKPNMLEFNPGEPVELNAKELEAVKADIGVCLMPCERDAKGKARIITDEVETEEEAEEPNVPQLV